MSSVRTQRSHRRRQRNTPLSRGRRVRTRSSTAAAAEMEDAALVEAIVVEDHTIDGDESCIDLTSTGDDEFVDLTSSQRSRGSSGSLGANDSSVVVIGTPDQSPPAHRRRRINLPPVDAFDDELPPVPFDLPSPLPSTSNSSASLTSPEPIRISCPICLDDDKTIKKEKRKFASTTCGHIFCKPCVEDSIRSTNCCPVCRKKLTLKNIFVIHL